MPISLEYMSWLQAVGLFALLATPVVLLGIRSLVGLGPVRRWVAVGTRLAVLLLMVLILAGARWQKINRTVEVMVLRDVSDSTLNVTSFPGDSLQKSIEDFLRSAADSKLKRPDDRIGVISFHSQSLIDAIPNTWLALDARPIRDPGNGTDLASAIQLGLATLGKDSMHRMVLMWDGNSNTGDIEQAVAAATSAGVPIDVMPLKYDVASEVLLDTFNAPTWKRENEPFTMQVILRSTNLGPVTGKLTVLHQGVPMDLDPETPGVQSGRIVTLQNGLNREPVRVPGLQSAGVHQFKASFEAPNVSATVAGAGGLPAGNVGGSPPQGDTLTQNNVGSAFTFVRGKGKVLYIDNVPNGAGQTLRSALIDEGINIEAGRTTVDQFPNDIVELQNYDAVILANVPRGSGGLSEDQQKMLASYVHDMGGGLVMVGGDESFGAGGWQGSRLEEVLPVSMDVPAQRQIPKGALVLVMHSCEMPNGNYWGEQCAIKATETLSSRDEVGVLSYAWQGPGGGGSQWDFPLQQKGDGSKVIAAIKKMQLGDMPSFDDMLNVAINGRDGNPGLKQSDARQKHIIVISDGDPQAPRQDLIDDCIKNKISITTITVFPHMGDPDGLPPTMKSMAQQTKGRFYGPINQNPGQLPQIFIKEATVVRRSLIHEEKEGIPLKLSDAGSELIKGLPSFDPIFGLVLTTRKPNPQIEVPLVAGKNNDPLLAYWQSGLGRTAVFTSDAHSRWLANWTGSAMYNKFWSQVVRSVARPPMSSDFEVNTVPIGGNKGRITVEALGKDNAFLNFLSINANVVSPNPTAPPMQ
ncbi:MAG TPA: VWA domain-containing protein, partial [Tepidisphaeraceae bacterium]|nr:VWA domain-containing protein [Tepidisphaeraceae bacterium]